MAEQLARNLVPDSSIHNVQWRQNWTLNITGTGSYIWTNIDSLSVFGVTVPSGPAPTHSRGF